jgi:hypothetical protein
MRAWLFMLPICYVLSASMLWGALDVAEYKRYRGRDGISRLLLHSFFVGLIFTAIVPCVPMW